MMWIKKFGRWLPGFAMLALFPCWAAFADCSKALTFGMLDFPPYLTWQDGMGARGLDADILKGVMDAAGCRYTVQQVPFKRALRDVVSGELDGMPFVSYTAERAGHAWFTQPVRREMIGAFIRQEDADTRSFETLDAIITSDARVGVVLGGWHGAVFSMTVKDNAGFASRITTAGDFVTLFRWLRAGMIDVAIVDVLNGFYLIQQHRDLDHIIAAPAQINVNDVHLMLSKKTVSESDFAKIEAAITAFRATDGYQSLFLSYAPAKLATFLANPEAAITP